MLKNPIGENVEVYNCTIFWGRKFLQRQVFLRAITKVSLVDITEIAQKLSNVKKIAQKRYQMLNFFCGKNFLYELLYNCKFVGEIL